LSRIEIRAEDVLTVACALLLVSVIGAASAFEQVRLSEEDFWTISFILTPLSWLVFAASLRYAIGREAAGLTKTLGTIGTVLRDWIPFPFFLVIYQTFRSNIWSILLTRDRDYELLELDRLLFRETPSVTLQRFVHPFLTDVMVLAYFSHLFLPPLLAFFAYRKEKTLFRKLLLAILVSGVLGSMGYLAVPAVGPQVAFPELFSVKLEGTLYGPVIQILDSLRAPRDVFPSLHVGISTIVLYFGYRVLGPRTFAILLLLVLGNWVSTLYLRFHYFVDVIAGWLTAGLSIRLASDLLRAESAVRAWWAARHPP
jgi:membrane-associated phospholipid phosphatase